jgi:hypothetical protein
MPRKTPATPLLYAILKVHIKIRVQVSLDCSAPRSECSQRLPYLSLQLRHYLTAQQKPSIDSPTTPPPPLRDTVRVLHRPLKALSAAHLTVLL